MINVVLDNIINSAAGKFCFKVFLIIFFILLIKELITQLFTESKKFYQFTKLRLSKFYESELYNDIFIEKKFLASQLYHNNDFFWSNNIIRHLKHQKLQLNLVKSGLLLLFNPKYIRKFFLEVTRFERSKETLEFLEISIISGIIAADRISHLEICIYNKGENTLELSMPKTKKKEWFTLNLVNDKKEVQKVLINEIENEEFLLNGRINIRETIKLSIFFETVCHDILRTTESFNLSGFIKTKGSLKNKYNFDILCQKASDDDEDYNNWLKNSMSAKELFNIMKQGGLLYILCICFIFSLFVSVFIENFIFKILIFIGSLISFLIVSHLNKIIVQNIYDIFKDSVELTDEK